MKYQKTDYTCGPASIVNALRALGIKLSETTVAELSGADKDEGVNEKGIIKSLKSLGYSYDILPDVTDSEEAWKWLIYHLTIGHPVILCVEHFSHWSSAVGILGNKRIIYVDPQDGLESNRRENGVRSLSRTGIIRIWGSRGRGYKRKYYGIAILNK